MPLLVRFWILLSALLVTSGWLLSICQALNRTGYLVIFGLAGLWLVTVGRPQPGALQRACRAYWRRLHRRVRQPLPAAYFLLAAMLLAAGLLYIPTNADSNGYRIPRILHWLAEGRWHWIHTLDGRMNIAGCGFEWLCTPVLLFTGSDRLFFLINWFSFLLLPGLVFSVFTRLGVRPRVAWWWMWLVPTGWCFVFQASSNVNDSFAAVYALAALDLALRLRQQPRLEDLWLATLAAALLTGTKQTAIPLALPWLLAVWPARRLLATRWPATLLVAGVCLVVSGVPILVLNHHFAGTWSGFPRELDYRSCFWHLGPLPSPFWGIVGNLFCLPLQNFLPPFFPWAGPWNEAMSRFVNTPLGSHFANFESFAHVRPGVSEASAGLGMSLSLLTLVSWWAARRPQRAPCTVLPGRRLRLVPWLLLLLFMAQIGTIQNGRQCAAYYPLLFPALLVLPGQAWLVCQRWWRRLVWLNLLLTVGLVVTARNRPMFPAQTIISALLARHPDSGLLTKATTLYSGRVNIETLRREIPAGLPPGEPLIGYAAFVGRSEPWVWLPYGHRRVVDVLPGDSPQQVAALGIHYVVVEDSILSHEQESIAQWAAQFDGEIVKVWDYERELLKKSGKIYLVHLRLPAGHALKP